MFPVLLEAGTFRVQAYGAFIALGYFAAMLISRRQARLAGFNPADFSDISFFALLVGVVGARALFVLTNLAHFQEHPSELANFWSGGLVFYGGFLVALPTCLWLLRRKRLPVLTSFDILAPGLAFGHAIGRIGCFAAGCCHGSYCPYPWGFKFDTAMVDAALRGQPLHPTQLYESAGLVALCAGLFFISKKKPPPGVVAAFYICGYALLRVVVEHYRGDSIRGTFAGASTSQWIAASLFCIGLAILARSFRSVRRNN